MNKKTLLSALMGISLAICVGATIMLVTRQNVHDAETLMGERPDSDASAKPAEDAQATKNNTPSGSANTPVSTNGAGTSETPVTENDIIEGGHYDVDEDEEIQGIETGINEVVESEQFPDEPEGSVIGAYRVTLHENALNWSQKANIPNIGDIIKVKVLPKIVYLMEVASITQSEDPEWTVAITGNLKDRSGYATVSLLDGKMHIKIVDTTNNRIYILYYDREKGKDDNNHDLYIVQELDTSLDSDQSYPASDNPFDTLPGATDVIEPDYDDVTAPITPQNPVAPAETDAVEKSLD